MTTATQARARVWEDMTGEGKSAPITRVQRKRTKGWRMPPNALFVGRPSRWGNPYRVEEYGREGAVERFRIDFWLGNLPGNAPADAREAMAGYRRLACWCALGDQCHATEYINSLLCFRCLDWHYGDNSACEFLPLEDALKHGARVMAAMANAGAAGLRALLGMVDEAAIARAKTDGIDVASAKAETILDLAKNYALAITITEGAPNERNAQ